MIKYMIVDANRTWEGPPQPSMDAAKLHALEYLNDLKNQLIGHVFVQFQETVTRYMDYDEINHTLRNH